MVRCNLHGCLVVSAVQPCISNHRTLYTIKANPTWSAWNKFGGLSQETCQPHRLVSPLETFTFLMSRSNSTRETSLTARYRSRNLPNSSEMVESRQRETDNGYLGMQHQKSWRGNCAQFHRRRSYLEPLQIPYVVLCRFCFRWASY